MGGREGVLILLALATCDLTSARTAALCAHRPLLLLLLSLCNSQLLNPHGGF